ncbi:MAG: DMT family transporter [Gammaproteobacteria bacterium]|nr:DMT family transporter [Gammaproteobacteria bacterium]
MRQIHLLYGVILVLASEMIFAGLSALVKYLSAEVSQIQMIFFRNLFSLLPLLPWLFRKRLSAVRTEKIQLHLLRATAGLSAMFIYFYAITHTDLVNAAMVLMLAPFFIPVLAALWLKQPQSKAGICSVILGFVGVLLCLYAKSNEQGANAGISTGLVVMIIIGAMLVAVSKATISKMTATESSQRIVFYFSFLSFIISGLLLPLAWQPISLASLGLLLVLGFGAVAAQLMLTKAFTIAPATTIGLLSYSSILFAALVGAIWWQEYPTNQWYAGAAIIVSAGTIAMFFNNKKRQQRQTSD